MSAFTDQIEKVLAEHQWRIPGLSCECGWQLRVTHPYREHRAHQAEQIAALMRREAGYLLGGKVDPEQPEPDAWFPADSVPRRLVPRITHTRYVSPWEMTP